MEQPNQNELLDALSAVMDALQGTRVLYMVIGAWALAVLGKAEGDRGPGFSGPR